MHVAAFSGRGRCRVVVLSEVCLFGESDVGSHSRKDE
jgi:hypothetical protein